MVRQGESVRIEQTRLVLSKGVARLDMKGQVDGSGRETRRRVEVKGADTARLVDKERAGVIGSVICSSW